jgi:hypothetical protein
MTQEDQELMQDTEQALLLLRRCYRRTAKRYAAASLGEWRQHKLFEAQARFQNSVDTTERGRNALREALPDDAEHKAVEER